MVSPFRLSISAYKFLDSLPKALTFVTLDFHTHNFGDMDTALHLLDMALSINSDNKEASILKGLVTQFLSAP